jgi:tetratricopeptide (TPR) repeat protein
LLEDVFALQDDITMCVVGAIEPSVRKAEIDRIKRQRPESFTAYDLLLRSQQFVFAGMPAEAAKAIPLLEEALKVEPDYSTAHAYLSWCLHARFSRGGLHEEDRLAAVTHARTAVALGNDDATALAIAALVLAYDGHEVSTALKVFDRALELSNCNVFALCWNAAILAWIGVTDLAIERAQLALRLGPFDSLIWRAQHALSIAYFRSRRYGEAADSARSVIDANPVYSLPRAILAAALVRLGRLEEAKAIAQTVLEREPSFTIQGTSRYAELEPTVNCYSGWRRFSNRGQSGDHDDSNRLRYGRPGSCPGRSRHQSQPAGRKHHWRDSHKLCARGEAARAASSDGAQRLCGCDSREPNRPDH